MIKGELCMRFYIDFENVGSAGLIGIESLTENDCVRIYYSNNPNVDMYTIEKMIHSPAKIHFVKLLDSLKMMNPPNALDIVILADISRIVASLGSNYAVVVSNDKGYDRVIAELNRTNRTENVLRSESIKSLNISKTANNNSVSKVIDHDALNKLFIQTLSKYIQHKDKIIKIVTSSKTRSEINTRISRSFDNKQSKVIMGALKPIIKKLPGQ